MCYLPHHQASHYEGVKDGEEAIDWRWIKAGQKYQKKSETIILHILNQSESPPKKLQYN